MTSFDRDFTSIFFLSLKSQTNFTISRAYDFKFSAIVWLLLFQILLIPQGKSLLFRIESKFDRVQVFPHSLSSLKTSVAQCWAFSSITGVAELELRTSLTWGKAISGPPLGVERCSQRCCGLFFFFLLNCTDLSVAKKLCVQFPLHH